jgi:signal transduction histidine kinase
VNLRQKFGLVALIYVLSLSANVVMSCWCIVVYYQSTIAGFESDVNRYDRVSKLQQMVQQLSDELETYGTKEEYTSSSLDTMEVITESLQQMDPGQMEGRVQEIWAEVQQAASECLRIAEQRAAAIDRQESDTAFEGELAELLEQEHGALVELSRVLPWAGQAFSDRRQDSALRAAATQETVIKILIVNALVGGLLCVSGLMLFRKWVGRPVADLRDATREIGAGNFEYRIKPRARDELGDLAREVNRMSETIRSMQIRLVEQERLAAAGEMVTRLAHNIRNPLAGIRGLAEATVASNAEDQDTVECQRRIIDTVDRFEKWLRDLQQSVSPLELNLQDVEIERLADDVVTALRPMLDRRQVEVCVEIDPEVKVVKIDALHFEQAVVSLLTNAVQASKAGQQVKLRVEGVADSEDRWRLSVEDEGTGIPEVIREKIFTPYFTTKPDGNGVGLAMVSKVVKIHGGQILLESEVGRGSCFTAVMPGRVVEV